MPRPRRGRRRRRGPPIGRNGAVAGCVQDISSLIASGEGWDAILDALADKTRTPPIKLN